MMKMVWNSIAGNVRVPVGVQADILHNEQEYQKSETIVFDFVTMNNGEGYNETTGIFIVPNSGLYQAYANAHVSYETPLRSPRSMELVINSTSLVSSNTPFSTGISSMTKNDTYVGAVVHAICYLKEGDMVMVRNVHPNTKWLAGTFTIALLHAEITHHQRGAQDDAPVRRFSKNIVEMPGR